MQDSGIWELENLFKDPSCVLHGSPGASENITKSTRENSVLASLAFSHSDKSTDMDHKHVFIYECHVAIKCWSKPQRDDLEVLEAVVRLEIVIQPEFLFFTLILKAFDSHKWRMLADLNLDACLIYARGSRYVKQIAYSQFKQIFFFFK